MKRDIFYYHNIPELELLLKPLLFFLQVPALLQHHVLPAKQHSVRNLLQGTDKIEITALHYLNYYCHFPFT